MASQMHSQYAGSMAGYGSAMPYYAPSMPGYGSHAGVCARALGFASTALPQLCDCPLLRCRLSCCLHHALHFSK
jgi:hypothetical protein